MWYIRGHEVEANMRILEMLGWNDGVIPHPYIPTQEVKGWKKGKYIGICAGFGGADYWKIKNWGYKRFAKLIELLLGEEMFKDYKIIVFGVGKDAEVLEWFPDMRKLKGEGKSVINAVDKYNIQESAWLVQQCDFLVCNDTGLGHVASAVGTKTYSIFGATSVVKNHPYRFNNVIRKGLSCQPCQFTQKWTRCNHRNCMNISPKDVFQAITDNESKSGEYEIGIVMSTFDRYELLYATLHSLNCSFKEINTKIKLVVIDDGSMDADVDKALQEFEQKKSNANLDVKVIQHWKNYGKKNYSRTLREGVDECAGCKYILFMPDDIVMNQSLFAVILKSRKYFNKEIKGINFMTDDRATRQVARRFNYENKGKLDDFFHYVDWTDGFLAFFEYDTIAGLKFENEASEEGSNLWPVLNNQMLENKYRQIRLNESLCLHIGNLGSKMNTEERKFMPIRSINVNLFDIPEILKKEGGKQ